jgi:PAS domain-containing protein
MGRRAWRRATRRWNLGHTVGDTCQEDSGVRNNQPVSGKEIQLEDGQTIVSRTDTKGVIRYINRDFLLISGFTEAELLGQPHNIIRHPDMPEAAFADMWATLKAGRP